MASKKSKIVNVPNDSIKRVYIITRLMYGVFDTMENRDTLRLSRLYGNLYRSLLVFKTKAPELEKELIKKSVGIWTDNVKVNHYKVHGDALYILLEYLSSLIPTKDFKAYFGLPNYIENNRDIPSTDKMEIYKIVLFIQNKLYEEYKIDMPTNTFVYKKVKVKKKRDKSKKVLKNKPVKKFRRNKESKHNKIKNIVARAKNKREQQEISSQYEGIEYA